jgi:hypothetical protein
MPKKNQLILQCNQWVSIKVPARIVYISTLAVKLLPNGKDLEAHG